MIIMPLSDSTLSSLIAVAIPAQISALFPSAVPMPFQVDLATACGKSFVLNIKAAKGLGAAGLTATGPGTGISGISASNMVSYAKAYFVQQVGSSGSALEPVLKGIFTPTVAHLALTTVMSASGFGGPLLKVTGLTPDKVSADIISFLPPQTASGIQQSKAGKMFIDAIAQGFCKEILAVGIPGAIPMAGITPGPTIAFFL